MWAAGATAVTYISSPTNVTFTNATSLFSISGSEYSALLLSSTSSQVKLSITRVPAFLNPTFYVDMYMGNTTNFNGTAGKYANMQLKLLSTGSGSAVVEITPIPGTIVLNPTPSRITVVDTTLIPIVAGVKANVTTVPTTSVLTTSTSVPTTATTTIGGQAGGLLKAQSILSSSIYFGLMNNYTIRYQDTKNCSASQYNLTFQAYNHFAPSGPSAYSNVSLETPYSMVLNITNSTTSTYYATYKTLSHSTITTGKALVLTINVVSGGITNATFSGTFYGQSYSSLSTNYATAKNLGVCGIMVA